MLPSVRLKKALVSAPQAHAIGVSGFATHPLAAQHRDEVLAFLAERPLYTIIMAGLIGDNGLASPLNRGTFHAYRDGAGSLEGVALIGYNTLIEARTESALEALAHLAQRCPTAHMILGERDSVQGFWSYYAPAGQAARFACRELLFEQRLPTEVHQAVRGLRQGTRADLSLVVPVHAEMAFAESGVDPLEVDAIGFRQRYARRIEQRRVWVWVEKGRLLFKADIIAETPEIIYLEGVYVAPEERSKGYGSRCLLELGRTLLARTRSICLLVNEQDRGTQTFYHRTGYKLCGYYDTIFL